jgi:hypothetical protein
MTGRSPTESSLPEQPSAEGVRVLPAPRISGEDRGRRSDSFTALIRAFWHRASSCAPAQFHRAAREGDGPLAMNGQSPRVRSRSLDTCHVPGPLPGSEGRGDAAVWLGGGRVAWKAAHMRVRARSRRPLRHARPALFTGELRRISAVRDARQQSANDEATGAND